MESHFMIEIEKEGEMIHQGEIFDQCSIGGQKNHYYRSRGLDQNEILIREIGGVYSLVTVSDQWSLNGRSLEPKKYYPLGKKNKLTMGIYRINIKKVLNKETGGLEIAKPKMDLKDLIGLSKKNEATDDFYADKQESQSKIHRRYFKRIGPIANLSALIFNTTIFYLITWSIIPKLKQIPVTKDYLTTAESLTLATLTDLAPTYVQGNTITIFSKSLASMKALQTTGIVLDQVILNLFFGFIAYFIFKITFVFIFGRPLYYFFIGVAREGAPMKKRVQGVAFEVLNLLLMPLNVYNLGGLLPFRSLAVKITGILFYRSSKPLGFFGPPLLIFLSIIFMSADLIYQSAQLKGDIVLNNLPSIRSKQTPSKEEIEWADSLIKIPQLESMDIQKKLIGKKEVLRLTSTAFKKSIMISELPSEQTQMKPNISYGNAFAFLTHPVHALKNVNLPIPNGNAEKFREERIDQINSALVYNPANIMDTLAKYGPMTIGFSKLVEKIRTFIPEGEIATAYWANNYELLILNLSSKILLLTPLSDSTPGVEIRFQSAKDKSIFERPFLAVQNQVPMTPPYPSLVEEIIRLIEKIDIEKISNNFNDLVKNFSIDDMKNKFEKIQGMTKELKNIQNQQKELTKRLNDATKGSEDQIKE